MANVDTSIILDHQVQYDPVGSLLKGYESGNAVAKSQAQAPLQGQIAQTALDQSQANVQSTQLGNQSQQMSNETQARQNAYQAFIRSYKLPLKENGDVDTQKMIQDHINAGFPDMALKETEELTKHQLSSTKNLTDRAQVVTQNLGALSNGINMLLPEQQEAAKEAVRQNFIQNIGVDPVKVYGPQWLEQVRNNQLTPEEQLSRMKIGADYQGMDPNSNKSKMMRQALQSQGIQVPESASAFDIVTRPEYKNLTDQLPTDVKVGLLNDAKMKQGSLDEIDASLRRIEKNAALLEKIRPFEKIRAFLDNVKNTPEAAEINQLVADLESQGIKIDNTTTLAGARDKLESLRAQIGVQIKRTQESFGSNSISQTGKILSSPTTGAAQQKLSQNPSLIKIIDQTSGKIISVTQEQFNSKIANNPRFKKVQ
jgi:hypothetical protein